jgi:hypothetical protein
MKNRPALIAISAVFIATSLLCSSAPAQINPEKEQTTVKASSGQVGIQLITDAIRKIIHSQPDDTA